MKTSLKADLKQLIFFSGKTGLHSKNVQLLFKYMFQLFYTVSTDGLSIAHDHLPRDTQQIKKVSLSKPV